MKLRFRSTVAKVAPFSIAGLIGALTMVATFLLARAVAGVPTPSELFADTIAPFLGIKLFGLMIALARGYTPLKIIGFSSTILGQLVVGAGCALALGRSRRPRTTFALIVAALYVVTVAAFWPVLLTQYHGVPAGRARPENLALYLLAYVVYFVATLVAARRSRAVSAAQGSSRRSFVAGALAGAAVVFGGISWARLFARASFSYDGRQVLGADVTAITPAEQFYCVTKNVTDPQVAPELWQLRLDGALATPYTLDLASLAKRRSVLQETTLMCINNAPEGGLMSNALWTGIPLRDLIGDGPLEGVRRVAFHAADNYIETLPIAKALEPTTLVAWQMNGGALLPKHGAPVRLLVPGAFGEKNVKWLTRIELVRDDRKGFYERQGWGPSFVIPTHSRIDVPADHATVSAGSTVEVRGVAFAGDRGVSRIEISADGGRTWREARFVTPYRQLAWRLWRADWRPERPGVYDLTVRATDATGAVQIAAQRPTDPQGATGLHRIEVRVA